MQIIAWGEEAPRRGRKRYSYAASVSSYKTIVFFNDGNRW